MKKFKLALLQTRCTPVKEANIKFILQSLHIAAENGANVSVLGQTCNSPYTKKYLSQFAEDFSCSETLQAIQKVCKERKMYVMGSIPRKFQNKLYNTGFMINKEGQVEVSMDKIHLFDIDIPNKITYKESDTFTSGNKICTFDTEYCKFGLAICYDLRFAQLGLLMAKKGSKVLVYPGSFNQTTGPLHFQLLLRGRALDTQCYTVGVSTAQYKDDPSIYQAWGHSTAVDPFGKVLVALDENPNIGYCEINPDYVDEVRQMIPLNNQKRNDLYQLNQIN